jgi:serine phosphatase RsbU (regulator of sigma subunit)
MTRHDDLVRPERLGAELDRIAGELRALARAQRTLHELYALVLGRDVGLKVVLREIVAAAMDLVDARYGALGVLSDHGDHLAEFVWAGLSEDEEAAAAGLGLPRGRGMFGHLTSDPLPLRINSLRDHPLAAGLPPGHPQVHTLLGVAISSRGRTYGNLYLSDRRDDQPFDDHDEIMIVALAGAAGLAIDDARLLGQVRGEAEHFQRLLLPRLPDMRPIEAAALYLPATAPGHVGGDWYDAVHLPDGTYAVVIGDIGGHGPEAAAAMVQAQSMLRALLYERRSSPAAVLTQLDRTLQAMTDNPVTTAFLARLWPEAAGWRMHWSTAGHPAPLLLVPGEPGRYIDAPPGLPLGVDSTVGRPDHLSRLPDGTTLVLFTDGLVEHHDHPIEDGLASLARLATEHASEPPTRLCHALASDAPGDGSDDVAILALRLPTAPPL